VKKDGKDYEALTEEVFRRLLGQELCADVARDGQNRSGTHLQLDVVRSRFSGADHSRGAWGANPSTACGGDTRGLTHHGATSRDRAADRPPSRVLLPRCTRGHVRVSRCAWRAPGAGTEVMIRQRDATNVGENGGRPARQDLSRFSRGRCSGPRGKALYIQTHRRKTNGLGEYRGHLPTEHSQSASLHCPGSRLRSNARSSA